MRILMLSILLLMVLSTYPVSADIYKYRDDQGVIRYTYDLAEVPEDQRPQVQTYEESTPEAGAAAQTEADVASDEGNKTDEKDAGPPVVDKEKIEELNQKKKELDKEFAGLMEEKYRLIKEKQKLAETLAGRDEKAVAAYDEKVQELNDKIADYQKRRDAFQKEADEVKKAAENPES